MRDGRGGGGIGGQLSAAAPGVSGVSRVQVLRPGKDLKLVADIHRFVFLLQCCKCTAIFQRLFSAILFFPMATILSLE